LSPPKKISEIKARAATLWERSNGRREETVVFRATTAAPEFDQPHAVRRGDSLKPTEACRENLEGNKQGDTVSLVACLPFSFEAAAADLALQRWYASRST
jgi:hypothetical protein